MPMRRFFRGLALIRLGVRFNRALFDALDAGVVIPTGGSRRLRPGESRRGGAMLPLRRCQKNQEQDGQGGEEHGVRIDHGQAAVFEHGGAATYMTPTSHRPCVIPSKCPITTRSVAVIPVARKAAVRPIRIFGISASGAVILGCDL